MSIVRYTEIDSPIGRLFVFGEGDVLNGLYMPVAGVAPSRFGHDKMITPRDGWIRDDAALATVRAQLGEYFAGERTEFELRLEPIGTPFQRRVWQALLDIPFAESRTYGSVANAIDSPAAVRAVGAAVGRNPISIIIPCHRVLGANGSLTGFGGGLDNKRWLLGHERSHEPGTLLAL
jgi:methylated-DNA-[protein]-cysteine S-methyltransferase